MVRRAASNMRKDLTCTKVLEIIMQPDPSSELQYVLSQTTDYNRLQGKCRKSTQGMCHYCTGERDSVSCSCPSRHKSTDTSRHQQLRSERGTCKWCRGQKKKNTQLLHLLWWTHLQRAPSDMLQSPAGKTEHTHTPQHTHTHTHTHHNSHTNT